MVPIYVALFLLPYNNFIVGVIIVARIEVDNIFSCSYPSWLYFILELWTFKVDELKITRKIGKRKIRGRKRIKQSRKIYSMGG